MSLYKSGIFATSILALMAACGSDVSNSETEERLSDSELTPGAVDVSLVDAIAPYDAESSVSEVVLFYRLQQQEYAILEDCIESKGVPRIGLYFELDDLDDIRGTNLPRFPDLEALEASGFQSITEADFWSDEDRNILSDDQQQAMAECDEESSELQGAVDLMADFTHLFGEWWSVLEEIELSDDVVELRTEFNTCALDEGIPPYFAVDETAFLGGLDALNARGFETLDEVNRELEELGQIYYRCGVDLFELQIDLRLERRDEFLDEHWDDIAELSQALYGDGIIEEDLSS